MITFSTSTGNRNKDWNSAQLLSIKYTNKSAIDPISNIMCENWYMPAYQDKPVNYCHRSPFQQKTSLIHLNCE